MEPTNDDLHVVSELRSARHAAVRAAMEGHISDVLKASPEALSSFTYVVKLLDVHPRLGKVKGRRLMADLGVAPLGRVSDLSADQRESLLVACGESA